MYHRCMSAFAKSNTIGIAVMVIIVLGFSSLVISSSDAAIQEYLQEGMALRGILFLRSVKINAGDSLTWYNPSPVAEPHTVTLITNASYFPPLAAPFSIPNDTDIVSTIPNPNVEPIFLPPGPTDANESKTVIMDNARAYNRVVVDSAGENVTYLPPNSNYTFSGTETYINSGLLFPQGQLPPGFPTIEEFTVTFDKPGTFG